MNNTSAYEDKIAGQCQDFGGLAASMVEIAERLDKDLEKALGTIKERETEAEELREQIKDLEADVETLREDIEATKDEGRERSDAIESAT